MTVASVFLVTLSVLSVYVVFQMLVWVVRLHFIKAKAILSATSAYDLCCLHRRHVISRRRLEKELNKWHFAETNKNTERLRKEMDSLLPHDPRGSFEEQVGRAYEDNIISGELYMDLLRTYNENRGH